MDLFKFLTGREHSNLVEYQHFKIHKDIQNAFVNLQQLAKKEIGADLAIISSFRDFERQKLIFNQKALGLRDVIDDQGQKILKENYTDKDFLEKILRFSALPGASRHHWGSDLDIYDAKKLAKDKVQLTPDECMNDGVFCELHSWLTEKIQRDESFGFYRPYNEDLGGISPEMWHLSYKPLAQYFYEQYTLDTFNKNIENSEIEFKTIIKNNADYYFEKYFLRIHL